MRFPTLFVALSVLVTALAADPSIVKLDSGVIQGNVTSKYRSFLGIPFTTAPVNELRWQPPQAVKAWEGVKYTTAFGNTCSQGGIVSILTTVSEDCLFLNVYAPYPIPAKPVPIMIFFYGGGWDIGSSTLFLYNAESDIALVEDVIIVTVNYRLGVFGFMASTAMRNQDPDGSTGNYGLQDQRFAMQWVQRNGAAFGGDINRVTIFGESAGAGSVSNHLLQPKAWPYFHRAIVESGAFGDWTAESFNRSASKYIQVAKYLNCCPVGEPCVDADPTVLACLRTRNTTELQAADNDLNIGKGILRWSPVVDGVEVLDVPTKLAAEGKIANVPIILGSNKDEGTAFNQCPTTLPSSQYLTFLTSTYGTDLGNAIAQQYPVDEYPNAYWASSHALGDSQMSCYARSSARAVATARQKIANPAPVYEYFFNHTLEAVQLFAPNLGCFHGAELVFVFDFELGLWTDGEKQLAQAFVKYWTSFAATGVPSVAGFPSWAPFTMDNQVVGVLDVNTILTPDTTLKQDVCDFWDVHPVPHDLIWG